MNHDRSDDCCSDKTRRSGGSSRALTIGVAGVALCCVLPSLLAGGALTVAAGWECGVWVGIGVGVASLWFLVFRRRFGSHGSVPDDPMSVGTNVDAKQHASLKVDE